MTFTLEEKHEDILNKQSEIWNRIKDFMVKEFNVEEIHNDKYLSTKIIFLEIKLVSVSMMIDCHRKKFHV